MLFLPRIGTNFGAVILTGACVISTVISFAPVHVREAGSAGLHVLASGVFAAESISVGQLSPLAVVLLIAAAPLISEDLALVSAGLLAGQGKISLAAALAASGAGIFIGDMLLYLAGRRIGRRLLEMRVFRFFITESALQHRSEWLERRGMGAIILSRFFFGLRLPLYFAAGVLRTSFWRFTLYFSLAAAVWTPLIVGSTYWLGAEIVKSSLLSGNVVVLVLSAAAVFVLIRALPYFATWKGRRLAWGRIRRVFFWEFWPVWALYLPVVLYIVGLGARRPGLTVFTCANPAMPAGGFVGESKDEILRASEDRARLGPTS